tara:strand:+ start:89137 stop:89616 length:480 start_codon:yes stop_codon:yes gene_type:complete
MNRGLVLTSFFISIVIHSVLILPWRLSEGFDPSVKTSVSSISVVLKSQKPALEGSSSTPSRESIADSGVLEEALPQLLNPIEPEYPWRSRMMREEGEVSATFKLNPQGQAYDIKISKSSGFSRLDESARQAITVARYSVEKDFPQELEITLNFKLKEKQ